MFRPFIISFFIQMQRWSWTAHSVDMCGVCNFLTSPSVCLCKQCLEWTVLTGNSAQPIQAHRTQDPLRITLVQEWVSLTFPQCNFWIEHSVKNIHVITWLSVPGKPEIKMNYMVIGIFCGIWHCIWHKSSHFQGDTMKWRLIVSSNVLFQFGCIWKMEQLYANILKWYLVNFSPGFMTQQLT